ncbi:MAG: DinB family protein [Saprospiraceae bacterium]|nr:DinB family protein [Saprospiraceae bacterium]MDW8229313.1 DinB family protein [Saprospiraceae bacterium]
MPINKNRLLQKYAAYQQRGEALLRLMAPYDDERLNRAPAPGSWSAMQVAHHLILVESLALRYVQKKLSFQPELHKAGWREWRNLLVLQAYLGTPLKFRAPDVVGEQHLPIFATLDQTRQQWQQANAAWRSFLENMPDSLCDKAVYRHPLVGRLSWAGMLAFFEAHLARHRRQLQRALRS